MQSQNTINEIEDFIASSNQFKMPEISYSDYSEATKYYKIIKNNETEIGSLYQFSSSGMGYCCYSFYKAKNLKIYVITSWAQKMVEYCILDNLEELLN